MDGCLSCCNGMDVVGCYNVKGKAVHRLAGEKS